ncbi:DUF551 domain-containing protein [Yersinia enterocolitica]|uniref:DUF551 domain-containing protein n=1 Tax=Yersinia enterocolitica TaxID=630 RepID=UPI0030CF6457
MKELDSFTVDRLKDLINQYVHEEYNDVSDEEVIKLVSIALAAKRAEPVTWWTGPEPTKTGELESYHDHETGSHYLPLVVSLSAYNTTPQLNSQAGLGSWIKCSDRLPEDDEFVRIWPLPDFGVELHVGQYIKFHKNGPGWFAQVYEYNYGVEFYPITVTHWMPLQPAPEKENG